MHWLDAFYVCKPMRCGRCPGEHLSTCEQWTRREYTHTHRQRERERTHGEGLRLHSLCASQRVVLRLSRVNMRRLLFASSGVSGGISHVLTCEPCHVCACVLERWVCRNSRIQYNYAAQSHEHINTLWPDEAVNILTPPHNNFRFALSMLSGFLSSACECALECI